MEASNMLKIKSCPRCRGDMYENRDIYGAYIECLQCGHMADPGKEREPARDVPVPGRRERAA